MCRCGLVVSSERSRTSVNETETETVATGRTQQRHVYEVQPCRSTRRHLHPHTQCPQRYRPGTDGRRSVLDRGEPGER